MTNSSNAHSESHVTLTIALALLTLLGAWIYFTAVPEHPPGFYIDESSIAYNAHLVARTGRDEHGEHRPLYFRAFGDYKNPIYIYFLAAIFKLTGPGISVARHLSAALGLLSGLLLGFLAWKITRRISVVVVITISVLLTPWLYESSRLVFEVALYPVLTGLFLLTLWRASRKQTWQIGEIVSLALTLALLTYSYSIGRMLAPLLAFGLALFVRRHGWRSVVKVWLAYGITLIPLFVFNRNHPGALSSRFELLTYITPQSSLPDISLEFLRHVFMNLNPWRWLVDGENNVRDHVSGFGSLLAATVILGLLGVVRVWREHRREPWWRFVLYGLLASVIPASLTRTEFPQLRLIAFPVFFHVLMIPALAWLVTTPDYEPAASALNNSVTKTRTSLGRRVGLSLAFVLIVIQGACFLWLFHKTANDRWYVFDARFQRKVLAAALATGQKPIYLYDPPGNSGYIQAYWYAALQGLDTSQFVHLTGDMKPPPGALVISTEETCENCNLIAKSINYTVYAVRPSSLGATSEPLSPNAFRAQIHAENQPSTLEAGTKETISVLVKNLSAATWPAVGRSGTEEHAVKLCNRWRRPDGTLVNDRDGCTRFPYDLEPGDTAGVHLELTAPENPGQYVLELDVMQEPLAWFGDKGSERLTWPVIVGPTRGVR